MYICDNKTKLRLFNGLNGEYWKLKGDEKKRTIYLENSPIIDLMNELKEKRSKSE